MQRIFVALLATVILFGTWSTQAAAQIWRELKSQERALDSQARLFQADENALRTRLGQAPLEQLLDYSLTIDLPMPDGSLQSYSVVESPIMEDSLARRFPAMKTFRLRGIDDINATGRADITIKGFRAMLQTSKGLLFIDRETSGVQTGVYSSRYRTGSPAQGFSCGVHQVNPVLEQPLRNRSLPLNRIQGFYQTYRIAVSATSEYVTAVGGSPAAAQAEILTAINRINLIYERDLGIRLLLVGNDGRLLEEDSDECFSNTNSFAMLAENQAWIDTRLGNGAYDIGHVFGTGPGGVARIGSACSPLDKAKGVSGFSNPVGDPFYIDLVAHEIGHQLQANHSFNGTTGSCASNRWGASAFEPGSGSTIMAYSGICSDENLQINSDATFHAGNIAEIDAFTAAGGSCYGSVANGNTDPAVTPLADFTIPAGTPFRLDVSASDIDLDPLVYQWDQMDSGDATDSVSFGTDLGNNPLFRTYEPQVDPWRDFPALGTQVEGKTDKAEVLPTASRTLNFRVTVRDDASGQAIDDLTLTVAASSGFRVTSQAAAGTLDTTVTPYTISWDVANTDVAPVNCANVDIDLLTFSDANYTTYSVHPIVASEINDGNVDIPTALPNSHPRARIRVKCSNNIFYDISDADLNVIGTNPAAYSDADFTTFFNTAGNGITVLRSSGGINRSVSAPAGSSAENGYIDVFAGNPGSVQFQVAECSIPISTVGGKGDASSFGSLWLLLLGGLAAWRRLWPRQG